MTDHAPLAGEGSHSSACIFRVVLLKLPLAGFPVLGSSEARTSWQRDGWRVFCDQVGRRLPKAVTLWCAGKSTPGKGNPVCCSGCHSFFLSSASESTNPLIVQAWDGHLSGFPSDRRRRSKGKPYKCSCSASTSGTMHRGCAVSWRLLLFSYLFIVRANSYIFRQWFNLWKRSICSNRKRSICISDSLLQANHKIVKSRFLEIVLQKKSAKAMFSWGRTSLWTFWNLVLQKLVK